MRRIKVCYTAKMIQGSLLLSSIPSLIGGAACLHSLLSSFYLLVKKAFINTSLSVGTSPHGKILKKYQFLFPTRTGYIRSRKYIHPSLKKNNVFKKLLKRLWISFKAGSNLFKSAEAAANYLAPPATNPATATYWGSPSNLKWLAPFVQKL